MAIRETAQVCLLQVLQALLPDRRLRGYLRQGFYTFGHTANSPSFADGLLLIRMDAMNFVIIAQSINNETIRNRFCYLVVTTRLPSGWNVAQNDRK
jgi:hypothetical protein